MTPGARIEATIELLDSVFESWQSEKRIPADKLIHNYFKSRRFIGSKDRANIGELSYWVLRHKSALQWHMNQATEPHGRDLVFAALLLRKDHTLASLRDVCEDGKYAPTPPNKQENDQLALLAGKSLEQNDMPAHIRLNYPEWMSEKLQDSFGDTWEDGIRALNGQAPTDLRVNTLKTTRDELLANLQAEGFDVSPTTTSPIGIRLAKRAPIFTSAYFKAGHFEVQDEGSQMVALLTGVEPGMKVIDFCAGAGGKTLAIAAEMHNKGRIMAWDTSKKRLDQIKDRLRRAGVDTVQTHVIESESDQFIKRHKASADRVLVDAPCSGTGTWRRNPDLKWRFTPKDLEEVVAVQQSILQSAARLAKPGGRLIYATCSILKDENEQQIERFLSKNDNFRVVCAPKIWDNSPPSELEPVSYLSITPHKDGVDGFFAAVLERLP
ncbi:MAG: RsmB/NOP family class I SAM-dependent RNA methyltransferase [Rickettsiales bacterium]